MSSTTIVEVTTLNIKYSSKDETNQAESPNPLEYSIHTFPKKLMREFQHVFREECNSNIFNSASPSQNYQLLAIPTNQKAREDLVGVGPHVEFEKDRLLNVFLSFASKLSDKLKNLGYWVDYIDPCSGLPMLNIHNHNKVYSEVDGMEVLLGYRSYNAGFCKVLVHPKWGTSVYPATIFCYAPSNVVKKCIDEEFEELSGI